MNLEDIPKQSRELVDSVANAVEKTGKQVATTVTNLTEGKAEEVTEEAIQASVDKALDVMQIAGERIREKNINGERVTLEIDVGILNVARLKIRTDIPGQNEDK